MKICREHPLLLLVAVLLSVITPTAFGQCVAGCEPADGDCVGATDCYCKPGHYGAACTDTCAPPCTASEVCIAADECDACTPTCDSLGGECRTLVNAPACLCNPEFTGDACDTIACGADDSPCTNGGTCVVDTCACTENYAGKICELECTAGCTLFQQCTAGTPPNPPTCECKPHLSGADCTTITCSTNEPCMNGGTCDSGTCACTANFAGLICQLSCNPGCTAGTHKCTEENGDAVCKEKCATDDDCLNEGTCTAELCDCEVGWGGDLCDTNVLVCEPVCTAEQKCVEVDGSNVCKTKCASDAECLNEGTCTAELCQCAVGWEGDLCDNKVLVCEPVCTAAQKCVEVDGSHVCKTKCANNDACLNGGTCGNELCTCTEGWTGDLCADSGVTAVAPSVLAVALLVLLRLL